MGMVIKFEQFLCFRFSLAQNTAQNYDGPGGSTSSFKSFKVSPSSFNFYSSVLKVLNFHSPVLILLTVQF